MAPARQTAGRRNLGDTPQNGEGSGALRRTPHGYIHQPACKPGSVGHRPLARTIRDGHSSGTTFARCLKQPTRTTSLTLLLRRYRFHELPALPSLFGLAPGGVYHAGSVAGPAVRSYRTFSPLLPLPMSLTERQGGGSGSFSVALSLGFPPPGIIRHRMSMEPGLSSPAGLSTMAGAAVRPTDVQGMGFCGGRVKPRGGLK